jgi:hypothetical protein
VELEKRGISTVTVITEQFLPLARMEAETFGMPDLPIVSFPHPIAALTEDEVTAVVVQRFPEVVNLLLNGSADGEHQSQKETAPAPGFIETKGTDEEVYHLFLENGWTDGFPIIPPTEERVAAFIEAAGKDADTLIGLIAPQNGEATVRSIAINACMAGARPDYMPVLIAAVKAMTAEWFNLRAIQTTTHPCAPLLFVNGPVAQRLGMNTGANAFGQGSHANATIGRAIRLILQNIGGALPGQRDRATQGQPSKFTYCVAENEAANPWEPLHVELGYDRSQSTVTVIGGENPHNVNDHYSNRPEGLMATIADSACTMGMNNAYLMFSNPMLCLGPEHADVLAAGGWSKEMVKQYIFEHARKTIGQLKQGGMYNMREWTPEFDVQDETQTVPIVQKPDDILVTVVGGPGRHSSFIPTFGLTRAVTQVIE